MVLTCYDFNHMKCMHALHGDAHPLIQIAINPGCPKDCWLADDLIDVPDHLLDAS